MRKTGATVNDGSRSFQKINSNFTHSGMPSKNQRIDFASSSYSTKNVVNRPMTAFYAKKSEDNRSYRKSQDAMKVSLTARLGGNATKVFGGPN